MPALLLIAAPSLSDTYFHRSVVLVWHHDEDGAMGVVVNRAVDHAVDDLLDLGESSGLSANLSTYSGQKALWGGPVESTSGTVICREPVEDEEGWTIASDLGVTRSQEILMTLIADLKPLLLCLGYAGWGPGQLDQELAEGAWLWTDCDASLLFDTPVDERYDRALASLGLAAADIGVGAPAEA